MNPAPDHARRRALLRMSLKLGCLGFGGGMALIAMARHEVVDRERWLDDETFLRDLAVAQAIPGGIAPNVITLLGLRAGGVRTAAACLTLFLLPSSLLMGLLAITYDRARTLQPVMAIFSGMGPAVVAITLAVGIQFLRKLRTLWQVAVAAASAVLVVFGLVTVFQAVLITGALALAVAFVFPRGQPPRQALLSVALPLLAWVFLQISLSMFGGGLAMIPVLDHQLVHTLGWLTPSELADAVTLSQITPGPLATASTFVGYRVAGFSGAVVATLALFLPAFGLTVAADRLLKRWPQSPTIRLLLEALSAAALGLILAAAVSLARSGDIAPRLPGLAIDASLAIAALVLLLRRINPLWVMAGTIVAHVALTRAFGL